MRHTRHVPATQIHDDSTPEAAPLTDAYRLLRRVTPPDAPVPGWLARCADERTVLLAAADTCAEWPGQRFGDEGHVLGVRDLVRDGTGTGVELEWCPERLERLLNRRASTRDRLSAGEAVTVAVSLLRGLAELDAARTPRDAGWPEGEWWMTDAARPVFVHGVTGQTAPAAVRRVLERLVAACAHMQVGRVVEEWLTSLDDPAQQARRWMAAPGLEEALFAVATPEPIRMTTLAPAPTRTVDAALRDTSVIEAPPRHLLTGVLERHVDSTLGAMVSDAVHSIVTRLRRRRRPKPWLLAAGAAAVVIVVGTLWPSGETPLAQADQVTPAPVTSSPSTPVVAAPADGADKVDLVAVATDLLDHRAGCGDTTCLAEVMEDPTRQLPPGPIDLTPSDRDAMLLDDFGGVAVVRVDDARGDDASGVFAQLVILAAVDGTWLLRDVHDVAQQPGAGG